MSSPSRFVVIAEHVGEAMAVVRGRLHLTRRGLVALGAALVAIVASGVILAAVSEDVIGGDGLELRDAANLRVFTDHRTPALISAAKAVTNLGGVPFLVVAALVIGCLLWWRGARLAVAAAPVLALGVAGMAAAVGKQVVNRGRPPVSLRLVTETEPSFPSGHATDSAAVYLAVGLILAVVVFRRPLARVLALAVTGLVALAIGVSRLLLGVHWPTDVVAGWALGAMVALAVTTVILLLARPLPSDPAAGTGRFRDLTLSLRRLATITRPSTHQAAAPT